MTRPAPMVDREALAKWYQQSLPGLNGYPFADALIASGILRPMPTREGIKQAILDHYDARPNNAPDDWYDGMEETLDAILALIGGRG